MGVSNSSGEKIPLTLSWDGGGGVERRDLLDLAQGDEDGRRLRD